MLNSTEHKNELLAFVDYLNRISRDFILKGGTALMLFYNLDRHSEDLDFDCISTQGSAILDVIDAYCNKKNYTYNIKKNTDFVTRALINYHPNEQMKIEVSSRNPNIKSHEYKNFEHMLCYNINALAAQKVLAYQGRDKIRDLYDVVFICNHYFDDLSDANKSLLINAFNYKGLEQFDYLIKNQPDPLIDADKLAEDLLNTYDKLGLLLNSEEKEIAKAYQKNIYY